MEIKVLVNGREVHSMEIHKDYYQAYTQLRNDLGDLVGVPLGSERPTDEVLLQRIYNKIHGIS